jgi:gluconate kinase
MLMEQSFALRMGIGGTGELTLIEQNMLTAEDRAWWMRKLEHVAKERQRKEKSSMPPIKKPSFPHH